MIERSTSAFSRSSAARVRPPSIWVLSAAAFDVSGSERAQRRHADGGRREDGEAEEDDAGRRLPAREEDDDRRADQARPA